MNCQSFRELAAELARADVPEAAEREAGLIHAESCAPCAARLGDERALTTLLRAETAARAAEGGAPAKIEENLRRAFREHARHNAVTPFAPRPRFHNPFPHWPRNQRAASFAIAALLLLTFTLLAARTLFAPASPPVESVVNSSVADAPNAPAAGDDRALLKFDGGADAFSVTPTKETPVRASRRETFAHRVARRRPVNPVVKTYRTTVVNGGASSPGEESNEAGELATDFIALAESGQQAPLESGQIVRVKVPRSTLASFGLPINVERGDESVKADILLGDDGLARAIRFIR